MESRKAMNTAAYLKRIGVGDIRLEPQVSTLRMLQRQHLLSVPFENLDIHWDRRIVLDAESFYSKVVERGRGGFCYELNGLFNELLRSIGFRTRLVSARVAGTDGHFSPEYDHAALIVTIGELEFLADVGFGAFAAEPLRLVTDIEQEDKTGVYVIRRGDDFYLEVARRESEGWTSEYIFKPLGRHLSEFAERCDYQQDSPDSHFKKGKLCSLMTTAGRKTLTDRSFVITANGDRSETPIGSDEEFYEVLEREFTITR